MSVFHTMPNGEVIPVPPEVVAQGSAAQQAFYDLQLQRIATEAPVATSEAAAPAAPAGSNA